MRYRVLHQQRGQTKWQLKEELPSRDEAVAFCTRLREAIRQRIMPPGKLKIKPLHRKRKYTHKTWRNPFKKDEPGGKNA